MQIGLRKHPHIPAPRWQNLPGRVAHSDYIMAVLRQIYRAIRHIASNTRAAATTKIIKNVLSPKKK